MVELAVTRRCIEYDGQSADDLDCILFKRNATGNATANKISFICTFMKCTPVFYYYEMCGQPILEPINDLAGRLFAVFLLCKQ